MKINVKMTSIQIGENTHHQDHAITLHNFRTTNATVKSTARRVVQPIPLFDFEFAIIVISCLFVLFQRNR
jgi:hypothetical protein